MLWAMPVPVISVNQMRQWEQATWATGQTEAAVIARVGELVGRRALEMTRRGNAILILAGKGHNGDDARQAAPHLVERRLTVIDVVDPTAALTRLAEALRQRPALIIDGLFGIGLSRPLEADWRELVAMVNEAARPVLAVDTPSGLNADTGEVEGAAVAATVTLTLGAPKRGLLASGAGPVVGRLELAEDIGLAPHPLESALGWTVATDFENFPPARPVSSHKGSFGHLAIVAGSPGYHGAAVLAARGAQRANPGLITLFPQEMVYLPVAAQLQAVMVQPAHADLPLEDKTAALVGPGLAAPLHPEGFRALTERLWTELEFPVVVDASGLDWLPPHEPAPDGSIRVITPHPGEAARLLQTTVTDVQADRAEAVRALSERFAGCWVVLKGYQTMIGRASGPIHVNSSGNSMLAQGGSGDTLAGYLAGWLAQPRIQPWVSLAIRYAVWEHGRAADRLSQRRGNWIVEDLPTELGQRRG